jgi:hypothetical protein
VQLPGICRVPGAWNGVELVQGLLDDRALYRAGQVLCLEVGVDDVQVAVPGQVEGGLSTLAHDLLHAGGPGAGGQRQLVGVGVAQGVKEFQCSIEGVLMGQVDDVPMDDFRGGWHRTLLERQSTSIYFIILSNVVYDKGRRP